MMELTVEEKRAINTLKRLSKKWPKDLWLFSANGSLCVMKGRGDEMAEGHDPDLAVATIDIPNDGGDW